MRTAARLGVVMLAAALATAGVVAQQPTAQPVEIAPAGTELYRALFDLRGIKPIKRQELQNLRRYDDLIVVVIGSAEFSDIADPVDFATRVLGSEGAALIAADTTLDLGWTEFRTTARIVGAQIDCTDAERVLAVREPGSAPDVPPRPLRSCPFVVPLTPDEIRAAPDPNEGIGKVFRGLTRVATNSPGYIVTDNLSGRFRSPLASLPRNTFQLVPGGMVRLPQNVFFAIGSDGGDLGGYQFLALADHSVFINQMLLEPGTDNLELADRTIEYLQGSLGQRKRCLFVENGRVVENFDGLRKAFSNPGGMPIPNLGAMQDKLTDLGNAIVDDIQTRNVPNTILDRVLGRTRVWWSLVALAAAYGVIHLLRRWASARKPTDVPPPPTVPGAPTGPPGVFDRRQKELLRRDNVYEPVRDTVREFFVAIGIHGEQGPRHPKLVIADVVRKPDSLRKAIRDFWKLAYGPPQEVSLARWRELEPYFGRLREAHADGKWRFVMPGAPVAAPA